MTKNQMSNQKSSEAAASSPFPDEEAPTVSEPLDEATLLAALQATEAQVRVLQEELARLNDPMRLGRPQPIGRGCFALTAVADGLADIVWSLCAQFDKEITLDGAGQILAAVESQREALHKCETELAQMRCRMAAVDASIPYGKPFLTIDGVAAVPGAQELRKHLREVLEEALVVFGVRINEQRQAMQQMAAHNSQLRSEVGRLRAELAEAKEERQSACKEIDEVADPIDLIYPVPDHRCHVCVKHPNDPAKTIPCGAARPCLEHSKTVAANAMRDVLAERRKQMIKWGPEHDAAHVDGELLRAACDLIDHCRGRYAEDRWGIAARNTDRRQRLVIAAALVVAEIDRSDAVPAKPA